MSPFPKMKKIVHTLVFALLIITSASCKKEQSREEITQSDKKSFLTFGFAKADNPSLAADIEATIKNDTVYVQAPSGTPFQALIAHFTFEGKEVLVGGAAQQSRKSTQSFDLPVTYTITAENDTQKNYIVIFGSDIPMIFLTTEGNAM